MANRQPVVVYVLPRGGPVERQGTPLRSADVRAGMTLVSQVHRRVYGYLVDEVIQRHMFVVIYFALREGATQRHRWVKGDEEMVRRMDEDRVRRLTV